MGQVLPINSIDDLVIEIRARVHDAGRAETTCAKHQLQAGCRLLELRKRIEAGEAGNIAWWDWYETQFTGHIKSRSYAEKLMRWAQADDPEAALESENTRVREAMRQQRTRTSAAPRNVTSQQNQQVTEFDIVERALRLVGKMNEEQRERFDAAYRRKYL